MDSGRSMEIRVRESTRQRELPEVAGLCDI